MALFVLLSLGIFNILINVYCQTVYPYKADNHSVCTCNDYLAEQVVSLKDLMDTKILEMEHKLQEVIDVSDSTKKCGHLWTQFHEKCYFYSAGIELSWWDSLIMCQSLGAILTVPLNVNENNYIKDIARKSGQDAVWIGISDAYTKGSWLSYPMMTAIHEFTDWGSGEPSGGKDHCGNIYHKHEYRWNDSPCNLQRPFICEKPL